MRNDSGRRSLFCGKSAGLLACVACLGPPLVSPLWFSGAQSDGRLLYWCDVLAGALVELLDLTNGLARYRCVRAEVIQRVSSNNSLRYSWTMCQSRED
jgi:hypothetical protein